MNRSIARFLKVESLGRKIVLWVSLVVLVQIVAVYRGYHGLKLTAQSNEKVIQEIQRVVQDVGELHTLALKQQVDFERAFRMWSQRGPKNPEAPGADAFLKEFALQRAAIESKIEDIQEYLPRSTLSSEEDPTVREAGQAFADWLSRFRVTYGSFSMQAEYTARLMAEGRQKEITGRESMREVVPENWQRTLMVLVEQGIATSTRLQQLSNRRRVQSLTEVFLLSSVGVALTGLLAVFLFRRMLRPVQHASELSLQISQGHRNLPFPTLPKNDEVSTLFHSLKQMVEYFSRSEKLLKGQRDYIETLLAASPLPFFVLNEDIFVEYANPAFVENYAEGRELAERDLFKLNHGTWRDPLFRGTLREVLDAKAGSGATCELSITDAQGNKRWVQANVRRADFAAADDERDNRLLLVSLIDLSAQKAVQDNLVRAKDEALKASEAKSVFLASMSHEIRTPLNAILGMSELLKETTLDPQQSHYVGICEKASQSLLGLLDDLLDFSRIEQGSLRLESVPFDVVDLAESVAVMMSARSAKKQLDLSVTIDPHLDGAWVGDPARLRQVLTNLVTNAIKFTYSGFVHLEVALAEDDNRSQLLRFSVTDTGVGVPEAERELIFERFQQGKSADLHSMGGSGLGLSIVKGILDRMGSKIEVSAREGGGSIFEFKLRLPRTEALSGNWKTPDLFGKRYLVVASAHRGRNVASLLERWGAQVCFQPMKEGLPLPTDNLPFDVVIWEADQERRDLLDDTQALGQHPLCRNAFKILMIASGEVPQAFRKVANLKNTTILPKPVCRKELARVCHVASSDNVLAFEPQIADGLSQASPAASAASNSILLVDDSQDNLDVLCAYLRSWDVNVEVARDGQEAFNKALVSRYSLIVMDLRMPVMDGQESARTIWQWEKQSGIDSTPILALTAYALEERRQELMQAGFCGFVTKPISRDRFLSAISPYVKLKERSMETSKQPSQDFAGLDRGAYLDRRRTDLAQMLDAAERSDWEVMRDVGHKWKGSGRSFGFPEITNLGGALEDAAKNGDSDLIMSLLKEVRDFFKTAQTNERSEGGKTDLAY